MEIKWNADGASFVGIPQWRGKRSGHHAYVVAVEDTEAVPLVWLAILVSPISDAVIARTDTADAAKLVAEAFDTAELRRDMRIATMLFDKAVYDA